jgi:hypothetical protein
VLLLETEIENLSLMKWCLYLMQITTISRHLDRAKDVFCCAEILLIVGWRYFITRPTKVAPGDSMSNFNDDSPSRKNNDSGFAKLRLDRLDCGRSGGEGRTARFVSFLVMPLGINLL